ncbi:MAG: UDP-glucose 4-epimerase GalE [Nitratireductor sp.]
MAILVTGGAGYIGSHMVWELLDNGEEVVVVDNLTTGFDWAVPNHAKLMIGSVGDRPFMRKVFRENDIEAVIHFAGSVVVPESVADPLKYYDNNTANTRNLLEVINEVGLDKLVFSSTAAVYGTPMTNGPIREDAMLNPMSPYGTSKLMSEMMIRDFANASDLRYVMLRYFNVAGCDPYKRTGQSTHSATHLIKLACEAATQKRPSLSVYGTDYDTPDGSGVRDFIHVSDLVEAHYVALQFLRKGGLKFTANCGYSTGYSVLEVIEAVKRISGYDFPVVMESRRGGDVPSVIANSHRAKSRLGWEPKYNDLDTIIRTALEWEKVVEFKKRIA